MKNSRIKVCHMTSAHGKEDIRIFYKECISLAEEGYDVYLVERGDSYIKANVNIVGIGKMPTNRFLRAFIGTKKIYKKAVELDCEIYHLHDPELLRYGLKLKKQGKKVVFDSHELTREQIRIKNYIPKFLRSIAVNLYSKYEDRLMSRLDGVIFPCPVNGEFPLKGKRKVYINNYPRLSEMYCQYKPNMKKEPNSLCTIGSLTYNRGIYHLAQAAALAECKLYLGGQIKKELRDRILAIPNLDVEFLGYLNREQVRKVYEKSSIGVATLLDVGQYNMIENLPTKAYECMAMGLPVVLANQKYNNKIINEYNFGVCVNPENIEEFVEILNQLMQDEKRRNLMGENGRKLIKQRYNWEIEKNNLFKLYEDILGE